MVDGLPLKKLTKSGSALNDDLPFQDYFSTLTYPRRTSKGNIRYGLEELIFLTLSAVVSGFQTHELIEGFGVEKLDWLRCYYPYKHGVSSHNTLGEFFSRVKSKALAKHDFKFIALDGKNRMEKVYKFMRCLPIRTTIGLLDYVLFQQTLVMLWEVILTKSLV